MTGWSRLGFAWCICNLLALNVNRLWRTETKTCPETLCPHLGKVLSRPASSGKGGHGRSLPPRGLSNTGTPPAPLEGARPSVSPEQPARCALYGSPGAEGCSAGAGTQPLCRGWEVTVPPPAGMEFISLPVAAVVWF